MIWTGVIEILAEAAVIVVVVATAEIIMVATAGITTEGLALIMVTEAISVGIHREVWIVIIIVGVVITSVVILVAATEATAWIENEILGVRAAAWEGIVVTVSVAAIEDLAAMTT